MNARFKRPVPVRQVGASCFSDLALCCARNLYKASNRRMPEAQALAIMTKPLPCDAFAHLGRQVDVAASVLRAALAGQESGVNILLYGPPGTGKTSLALTLAVRIAAHLRPLVECDEDGGEPSRYERLARLCLAQRLAASRNTLLLFDEAEDLFVDLSLVRERPRPRVFIHRLLERMTVPVIWMANDIGAFGPAVLLTGMAVLGTPPASADTTYYYVGNPYSSLDIR